MATLMSTPSLNPMSHPDPKSVISPTATDSTRLPLLEALGLPGNGELESETIPVHLLQKQTPPAIMNSSTNHDIKRPRRASKAQSRDEDANPERARHLERNRIAANKCRRKKKVEHEKIQNTLNDESMRRDSLLAEVGCLKEEIWHLKNQVFKHAKCEDQQINSQLAWMMQNALANNPEQGKCPSPSFSVSTQSDGSNAIDAAIADASASIPAPGEPAQEVPNDDFDPALFDKFQESGDL